MLKNNWGVNKTPINNTVFEHDMTYKYTWQNTRHQQSIVDYMITNATNIGSDDKLLLCKVRLNINATLKPKPCVIHKFKSNR